MELLPGAGTGGGASSAGNSRANKAGTIKKLAECGTRATLNGRVGEYVATGLTAVWSGCAWQQEWLAGIIEEPHCCAIF